MKFRIPYWSFLLVLLSLILVSGCVSSGAPGAASPPASPTSTQPAGTTAPLPQATSAGGGNVNVPGISDLTSLVPTLAEAVPTRTPEATATPDALSEQVSEIVAETGLAGKTLFGLEYADWINLVISLLYVLISYLLGTWMIRWLFPRLVRRTKTLIDDLLLQVAGDQLRWLVVVMISRSATDRLSFINNEFKATLTDIYFFLNLFLLLVITWRLIDLIGKQVEAQANKSGHQKGAKSLITLMVWALRFFTIIIFASISLNHFAVNITGFAIFLGVIGLVFSLASRDILADIVSGALILVDRPYRIGDRIELTGLNSWGDVVEIGMRSTKVLTLDNRMVVVPNSLMGKNQVVNYSYPDPSYYDMSNIVVAYDNDADQVAQLLVDTIRSVEGVQKEREVDALLMELTENQMIFWTGWWIASYVDRYMVHDRVNRAMMKALKESGIILPYHKGSLNWEVRSRKND